MISLKERFFSYVNVDEGCWLWTGAVTKEGYGVIRVNGRNRPAHQISWELDTGLQVSAGKVIRHKCDTPQCVNPAHLLIGTPRDNVHDAISRNRNSIPRIDAVSWKFIRYWIKKGYKQTHIAQSFGVNQSSISRHAQRV